MRLEILDGLGKPLVLHCTRVLVSSDDGTPLSCSVELAPGVVKTAHAGEAGDQLNRLLKGCGVDRTVVTTRLEPKPAIEILRP